MDLVHWSKGGLAVLPLLAAALASPAAAQEDVLEGESVLDRPVEKEGWPEELTRRGLTLPPGMIELQVPLGVNLSDGHTGEPTFLAPSVAFGAADGLTLALRHAVGLCLTGADRGCPQTYRDVALDAVWRLARGPLGEVALGGGLAAAPVSSPFALSGEVRMVARIGGPLTLAFAPAVRFGIVEREAIVDRPTPLAFPLGTYAFGWYETEAQNREYLTLPLTVISQVGPRLALALGFALDGPLGGSAGFWDSYRLPVGAALVLTASRAVDVGAGFTVLNLLGRQVPGVGRWDERALQVFAAFRM